MNERIKYLTLTSISTALICICSVISLNFGGIPFSLSLLAVFVCSMVLPPTYALLANISYILIGIIGLPVFSGFSCGVATLIGPSGGFIFSYPLVSLTLSILIKLFGFSHIKATLFSLLALMICYASGSVWYSFVYHTDLLQTIIICVLPYVIIDMVKIQTAILLSKLIFKHIKKQPN